VYLCVSNFIETTEKSMFLGRGCKNIEAPKRIEKKLKVKYKILKGGPTKHQLTSN